MVLATGSTAAMGALVGLCAAAGIAPAAATHTQPAGGAIASSQVSAADSSAGRAFAEGGRVSVILESCGRMRVDGRSVTLAGLRDILRDRVGRGSDAAVDLVAGPDIPQDYLDAMLRRIAETGVEPGRIHVRREAAPPAPLHEARAVGAWLKRLWPGARRAAGAAASDESRIAREVESRGESLQSRIEAVERVVEPWLETARAASRPASP